MPHFFINSNAIIDKVIEVSDKETYTHIAKSLRTKIGEKLLFIDENQIQYETVVSNITSSKILANIEKQYKSTRLLEFELFIAQAPLKSDSQTLVVEKITELGAKGIYPIYTDNCALSKDIINKKIPKWQKIMFEASKQCERADIPTCFELTNIEKLTNQNFDRILAFTERSAKFKMKEYLRNNPLLKNEKVLVIIGPEGGFSQKEFDFFEKNGVTTLSLGELILKAETAAITAIGNILYEFE